MPKQDYSIDTNLGVSGPVSSAPKLEVNPNKKSGRKAMGESPSLSSNRIALHSLTNSNRAAALSLRQADLSLPRRPNRMLRIPGVKIWRKNTITNMER